MSDYSPTNNFAAKAELDPSDPDAEILGADFDTEFAAIQTAVATKYDSTDLSDQATAETGTDNTVLMTPLRSSQALAAQLSGANISAYADEVTIVMAEADEDTNLQGANFATSSYLTATLTAGKLYEVWIFVEGNFGTSPSSGSGNMRLDYSNAPQQIAIAGDADDDLLGGGSAAGVLRLEADTLVFVQAVAGGLFGGPHRGIIRANAGSDTIITVEWQWGGVSGSGTYINEGSFLAVRQLD